MNYGRKTRLYHPYLYSLSEACSLGIDLLSNILSWQEIVKYRSRYRTQLNLANLSQTRLLVDKPIYSYSGLKHYMQQ